MKGLHDHRGAWRAAIKRARRGPQRQRTQLVEDVGRKHHLFVMAQFARLRRRLDRVIARLA